MLFSTHLTSVISSTTSVMSSVFSVLAPRKKPIQIALFILGSMALSTKNVLSQPSQECLKCDSENHLGPVVNNTVIFEYLNGVTEVNEGTYFELKFPRKRYLDPLGREEVEKNFIYHLQPTLFVLPWIKVTDDKEAIIFSGTPEAKDLIPTSKTYQFVITLKVCRQDLPEKCHVDGAPIMIHCSSFIPQWLETTGKIALVVATYEGIKHYWNQWRRPHAA